MNLNDKCHILIRDPEGLNYYTNVSGEKDSEGDIITTALEKAEAAIRDVFQESDVLSARSVHFDYLRVFSVNDLSRKGYYINILEGHHETLAKIK